MFYRWVGMGVAALCVAAFAEERAWGVEFATSYLNYDAGLTYPSPDPNDSTFVPPAGAVDVALTNPAAALGSPNGDTGYGPLTPFNAAYGATDVVGLGYQGSITLHFATPVPGDGTNLAVHAAVGLADVDYPYGQSATGTEKLYTSPRTALLSVSSDGTTWVSLGEMTFDNPTNFYAEGVAPPDWTVTSRAQEADFGQPFLHTLDDFSGLNWTGVLGLLDGSGGGTWIDLSPAGLATISYVRFDEDTPGATMYLDAVAAIPEPGTLGMLALAAVGLLARRRR